MSKNHQVSLQISLCDKFWLKQWQISVVGTQNFHLQGTFKTTSIKETCICLVVCQGNTTLPSLQTIISCLCVKRCKADQSSEPALVQLRPVSAQCLNLGWNLPKRENTQIESRTLEIRPRSGLARSLCPAPLLESTKGEVQKRALVSWWGLWKEG